jgi:hypothetical protein
MWPADEFGEFEFHVAIRTDFHLKLEWCSSTDGVVYILVEDVVCWLMWCLCLCDRYSDSWFQTRGMVFFCP